MSKIYNSFIDSYNPDGPIKTIARGMPINDIILKTAIEEGIRDLRTKPYLLEQYCFASLAQDKLSAERYGFNEAKRATEWFLRTNIPVFLDVTINEAKLPAVSIKLQSQEHAEATLADVNYQPQELANFGWPDLAGPFVAQYNYTTGIVTIPDSVAETLVIAPGQIVVDNVGNFWEITATPDYTHLQIPIGQTVDFTKTYIRGQKPAYSATLESMLLREVFTIGVHVSSEASHLIYLYSIISFILLVYKQSLLEARGLERTLFTASDFILNPTFKSEIVFSRYITLTGYSEASYPKTISQRATAINTTVQIADSGHLFPDPSIAATQLWIGDQDTIGNGTMPKPTTPIIPSPLNTGGGPYPLVYWGVQSQPGGVIDGFITALGYSAALPGRQTSITYNAVGDGLYCWYAYPAAYGGTSDNFIDGGTGFPFGASNIATVNIEDTFGVTRPYFVFRSDYANLGLVYLNVS